MAFVKKDVDPNLKNIDDTQTILKQSAKKMKEAAEKAIAEKENAAKKQALENTIKQAQKALEEANKKLQGTNDKKLVNDFQQIIDKVKESEMALSQKTGNNDKEAIDKIQEAAKEMNKKEQELQKKKERLQAADLKNQNLLGELTAGLKKTEESLSDLPIKNNLKQKLKDTLNTSPRIPIENLVASTGRPGPRGSSGGSSGNGNQGQTIGEFLTPENIEGYFINIRGRKCRKRKNNW